MGRPDRMWLGVVDVAPICGHVAAGESAEQISHLHELCEWG